MKSVFDVELMKPEQLKHLFITVSQVGDKIFNVAYSVSASMIKSAWYATQDKIIDKIPISSYRCSL